MQLAAGKRLSVAGSELSVAFEISIDRYDESAFCLLLTAYFETPGCQVGLK
jgi:hypothetical protein